MSLYHFLGNHSFSLNILFTQSLRSLGRDSFLRSSNMDGAPVVHYGWCGALGEHGEAALRRLLPG